MAFTVLDEGVGHARQFASAVGAEEQVVFGAQFERSDRVFDEVVVNFYPAILEVSLEARPLIKRVGDGLAHEALREVARSDPFEVFFDESQTGGAVAGADGFF